MFICKDMYIHFYDCIIGTFYIECVMMYSYIYFNMVKNYKTVVLHINSELGTTWFHESFRRAAERTWNKWDWGLETLLLNSQKRHLERAVWCADFTSSLSILEWDAVGNNCCCDKWTICEHNKEGERLRRCMVSFATRRWVMTKSTMNPEAAVVPIIVC